MIAAGRTGGCNGTAGNLEGRRQGGQCVHRDRRPRHTRQGPDQRQKARPDFTKNQRFEL